VNTYLTIPSDFCCIQRAGAQHVVAIDKADIIRKAKYFAEENKLNDKITFIHSKVEEVIIFLESLMIVFSVVSKVDSFICTVKIPRHHIHLMSLD
jgi:hypothetical protein